MTLHRAIGWAAVLGLAGAWVAYQLWPRRLSFRVAPLMPRWEVAQGEQILTVPGHFLVAELGRYRDELFAYLMIQYLRSQTAFDGAELLLTYQKKESSIDYSIRAHLSNDILSAVLQLAAAREAGLIEEAEWRHVTADTLRNLRDQNRVIEAAYGRPVRRRLEDLSQVELVSYLRRFVRFKSVTDPRIRRRLVPIPQPLTSKEALQLASDIVAVSEFYSLPIEFFIGIGAMENNYMNVPGDLKHAVWKRRQHDGDVVLRRVGGRVLVWNPSSGVWQITRETLRYAHALYLADTRDYSRLPAHLVPSRGLEFDRLDPPTLTTYAGLLFRHLLDRCSGDIAKAVGAYNGGLSRPNEHYAAGVESVAKYARRVLEQSAILNGRPAAGARFFAAGR